MNTELRELADFIAHKPAVDEYVTVQIPITQRQSVVDALCAGASRAALENPRAQTMLADELKSLADKAGREWFCFPLIMKAEKALRAASSPAAVRDGLPLQLPFSQMTPAEKAIYAIECFRRNRMTTFTPTNIIDDFGDVIIAALATPEEAFTAAGEAVARRKAVAQFLCRLVGQWRDGIPCARDCRQCIDIPDSGWYARADELLRIIAAPPAAQTDGVREALANDLESRLAHLLEDETWDKTDLVTINRAKLKSIVRAVLSPPAVDGDGREPLVKALQTIRGAIWSDGETCDERIADVKEIARRALEGLEPTGAGS